MLPRGSLTALWSRAAGRAARGERWQQQLQLGQPRRLMRRTYGPERRSPRRWLRPDPHQRPLDAAVQAALPYRPSRLSASVDPGRSVPYRMDAMLAAGAAALRAWATRRLGLYLLKRTLGPQFRPADFLAGAVQALAVVADGLSAMDADALAPLMTTALLQRARLAFGIAREHGCTVDLHLSSVDRSRIRAARMCIGNHAESAGRVLSVAGQRLVVDALLWQMAEALAASGNWRDHFAAVRSAVEAAVDQAYGFQVAVDLECTEAFAICCDAKAHRAYERTRHSLVLETFLRLHGDPRELRWWVADIDHALGVFEVAPP